VKTESLTIEEAGKLIRPDSFAVLCMMRPRRIGAKAFIVMLEHEGYDPRDEIRNQQFQLVFLEWQGMLFAMVIIPERDRAVAEVIAARLGVRFADGLPTVIHGDGVKRFPLRHTNLFTLENVTGHVTYKNDLAARRAAFMEEDMACEKVFQQFDERAA